MPGILRALIAAGGDVNAPDPRPFIGHMNAPLHQAANAGSAELVRILLDAGGHVDARCADGWTPLMRACNAGEIEVAKLLVNAGADIDARNSEGYTAYGRIPGNAPELPDVHRISSRTTKHRGHAAGGDRDSVGSGAAYRHARHLRARWRREDNACRSTEGALGLTMLGDLREDDEVVHALAQAQRESVVGVVRSGESFGLSSRWQDMGIPQEVVASASVTTITLRRLPRSAAGTVSTDFLAVEVLGPDRDPLTGSLAEQAKTLVSAGPTAPS